MSQKRFVVELTESEREDLLGMIKRGKGRVNARKREHARVLLKVDEGPLGPAWSDVQTADAFEIHPNTVRTLRQRLVLQGMEVALNRKKQCRPSVARKLDGAQEARVIALACSTPPEGFAKWSLRLLANKAVELKIVDSISHETIRQTLKKTISNHINPSTG
ncbi:MAG: helix-turn-helix domain-containing protein [Methylococcales bacterium]|nr:helix-turn-helix domain-containing protein [Methylococcales bacterium]